MKLVSSLRGIFAKHFTLRDIVYFVYWMGFFMLIYYIAIAQTIQTERDLNACLERCAFKYIAPNSSQNITALLDVS